jgi:hypothetical protein
MLEKAYEAVDLKEYSDEHISHNTRQELVNCLTVRELPLKRFEISSGASSFSRSRNRIAVLRLGCARKY